MQLKSLEIPFFWAFFSLLLVIGAWIQPCPAHTNPGDPGDCEVYLLGSNPQKINVVEHLDRLTLTSAMIYRDSGLPANSSTEIARLKFLNERAQPMELAVYNSPDKDAESAKKLLRRMNRLKITALLDPHSIIFVGRDTLKELAAKLSDYPHVARLLIEHGTFARARQVDRRFVPLELSPRLESKWAHQQIQNQFQRFRDFVLKRNVTAPEFQFLISATGEFRWVNPEAIRYGTRTEAEVALAELSRKIEEVAP